MKIDLDKINVEFNDQEIKILTTIYKYALNEKYSNLTSKYFTNEFNNYPEKLKLIIIHDGLNHKYVRNNITLYLIARSKNNDFKFMESDKPVAKYIVEEYPDRIMWKNTNGELHRVDGPALVYNSGFKSYWNNGLLHRVDGPAIIDDDNNESYYLNGQQQLNK